MSDDPRANPEGVLSVRELRKQFGAVRAVDGVSFTVRRGEVVGLLGPNGAGKTTTINMVLGVLRPDAGTVAIEGRDVLRERATALACTNFAAVYAPMPGNLTVEQSLRFFGMVYGVAGLSARIAELLEQFDLARLRRTRCGVLSSGEQSRVSLAKALLNRPRLLLLDEPTASLDPATAQDMRARIVALARGGACGILWTSHNMYEVEEVCDRVLFLSQGRILAEGRPAELLREHAAGTLEELFIRFARRARAGGGAAA